MTGVFSKRGGGAVVLTNRSRSIVLVLSVVLLVAGCQGTPGLISRIEPPELVSPPDGAVLDCPPQGQQEPGFVFAWTQVRGASHYVLEVYRAADGFLVASKKVDPGEGGVVTLFCGLEYLWRVAAVADYPTSAAWSVVWRFSITAPPAGATRSLQVPARPR